MSVAPTLTSARLTLRHHGIDEFDPMADLFATDWSRYMGRPIDRDALWRSMTPQAHLHNRSPVAVPLEEGLRASTTISAENDATDARPSVYVRLEEG